MKDHIHQSQQLKHPQLMINNALNMSEMTEAAHVDNQWVPYVYGKRP